MKFIALFFPAILSMAIDYKKNNGETWNWFDYLYKYTAYVICNVFFTESVVSYIFKKGSVSIDALNSFSFFTKYILAASVFALILPHFYKIVKENISVSFEIHRIADDNNDSQKTDA